jgi:hypothetical protein
MIAQTVEELIRILKTLRPNAVPVSIEPMFNGVKVIPNENGTVTIAPISR